MKPILKYAGGKSKEIPQFKDHIPKEYDTYIEPFIGGGSLYFHLEPKKAIISDKNAKLIGFYQEVRDNYPVLRKELDKLGNTYKENQGIYKGRLQQTPNVQVNNPNADLYYKMREQFNNPDGSIPHGVVYYFINKTAYSGMTRYNKAGEFNVPFGHYANLNTDLLTKEHSDLLQGADIYNEDYEIIFNKATTKDFMFLDPPYDCVFNSYGNLENEFDEHEQRRLAENFKNLSCRALMIIGKTPLIDGLYKGYIVGEYDKNYSVNIRNRVKATQMHAVIKNY